MDVYVLLSEQGDAGHEVLGVFMGMQEAASEVDSYVDEWTEVPGGDPRTWVCQPKPWAVMEKHELAE